MTGDRTPRTEQVEIEGVPLLATYVPGGRIGLLALHGSNEGGTAELAGLVARRCDATSLVFTQPGVRRPVHLPSARMAADHCALLREFLDRVALTVSLHGHMRPAAQRTLFLGGGNRTAAHLLAAELAALAPEFRTVTDLAEIPRHLRGLHPRNPVNLTRLGGVQVELPLSARTTGTADTPPAPVAGALTAGVVRLAHAVSMSTHEPS
ncbi:poly-gamma-glutamate hydrolase family protein [Streptomyces sp. LP11]|uniref:Poly-gamma-glutamate hydrolase family protein n=1 Tax=Streptomyces pyxinicus TaxID=2970331 RepID=A0ABT2AU09_9ACTN|nr:poly-gamma-glutamate hydrolase family protein [Streptomyces sp. LP11]MCS0599732.1 poly-gamma-glutamate hydrolase family protein [Streptomyces sp. LP11]